MNSKTNQKMDKGKNQKIYRPPDNSDSVSDLIDKWIDRAFDFGREHEVLKFIEKVESDIASISMNMNDDSGGGGRRLVGDSSNGQRSQSEELLAEWRSDRVENGTPSTFPPCWNIDVDDYGSKPSELYGIYTWKIEKFSEINQRKLHSNVFEVGGYKWCILIYPEGCNVYNHLSLFLCVANHDKLLPGWSHFAQFTITMVNKDSKKSLHSDTLHRFWKKEHDCGWKKFMELPKLYRGFIDDSDSLTIKAQVQVIRERVDRPFRCLHSVYRKELVRVYLANVEQICWQFVDEKKSKFGRLIRDKEKWASLCAFWIGLDQNTRSRMSREKMDVILKKVVKHFFIENEVTSTLVMDSLYNGLKALEGQTKNKKCRPRLMDNVELEAPIVSMEKDVFLLVDDVLLLLGRAAREPLPLKGEIGPLDHIKSGNAGEEFSAEAIEHDEKRLTELARRTLEIFVLAHIFSNKIEVSYQEAIAWKRQEELIREEEEAWLAESKQKAKKGVAEKEKKSKKKQTKQKKNKTKGKDKKREEKVKPQKEERDMEKEECVRVKAESSAKKPEMLGDLSDISDSVDSSTDILPLDANSLPSQAEDQPSRNITIHKNQSHFSRVSKVDEAAATISLTRDARSHGERNPVGKDRNTIQMQEKSADVRSSPRAAPWNHLSSIVQTKLAKQFVSNVDNVQKRKPVSAKSLSSDQASPSRDIQLQTMDPRVDIQKTASLRSPSQPTSSILRPLSAPMIPPKQAAHLFPPKQASPVTTTVQTFTSSLARSMSSTCRLSSPTHSQAYIPQSYKHAIVSSSGNNHSSSQSTRVSTLPSYSHPSPISVSNQSGFSINTGSWDVSSGGLLWTGGSSSDTRTSGNHRMNHYNKPVAANMRPTTVQRGAQQSLMTDDYPHLDIINDLLEEEHGMMDNSLYHVPQMFNNQYMHHGGVDLGISGRSRIYNEDVHQACVEYMLRASPSPSSSPYSYGQMDGLTQQTQWPMADMNLSLLAMRNEDEAAAMANSYFDLESSSRNLSSGINGYRDYWPWNGR